MQSKLDAGRLEGFLKLISACTPLRDYDPVFRVLAQHTQELFEFERFNILLCGENRQILKTVVIQNQSSCEIQPDEIQLSEMDLILQTLITAEVSSGSVGVCIPMIAGERMIGLLCFVTGCGQYSKSDRRLLQSLSASLAGTFGRLAQGSMVISDGEDAETLLQRTDIARYRAKHTGRGERTEGGETGELAVSVFDELKGTY